MPGFEWFGDEERKEVSDVLDTGVLFRFGFDQARKNHWKAKTFEMELAHRMGVNHALLCSSGTAALSIALSACGVGAGDEVIVPPFTFIATLESVLHAGAVPVFAEIDETLCLDPKSVKACITPRTQAVLPVHMCGAMARIDEISDICTQNGLVLIEDACQAMGATFNGKALGTFGQMGCFSFDAVKTVTCGEGGAVITDDSKVYDLCHQYADHGHDHLGGPDRGADGHPILGSNFRISELNAAVGLAQLRKLDRIIKLQRKNKQVLKDAMTDLPGISFRYLPDPFGDSATFLSFMLPTEAKARQAAKNLADNQVPCPYWYDNNWHYFRKWQHLKHMTCAAPMAVQLCGHFPDYKTVDLPESDAIMKRTLSMQIMLSWTDQDLEQRIQAVKKAIMSIN